MEETFTLFLEAMVVTQSSICLLPLVSKVFTDRVSMESGLNFNTSKSHGWGVVGHVQDGEAGHVPGRVLGHPLGHLTNNLQFRNFTMSLGRVICLSNTICDGMPITPFPCML